MVSVSDPLTKRFEQAADVEQLDHRVTGNGSGNGSGGGGGSLRSPLPFPIVTPFIIGSSITEPLINLATEIVDKLGLGGVFVAMLLESACIPLPSEATMLFAGFAVHKGSYSLVAATAAGVLGNVVGSWLAWWLGRIGRIDLIEKHGRKVGIRTHHLEVADRWFERHGEATVFFSRMLPIVRTFISLPAGVAGMPFWRFTIYTALGCIPWVFALTWAGMKAGENWKDIKGNLEYVDYAVAACLVVGVIWLVIRYRRNRVNGTDLAPAEADRAGKEPAAQGADSLGD